MEKELLNENQRRIVLKALGLFPLAAGSVLLQSGLSGCSTTTEPSGNNVDLKVSEESALNNIDGFLRRTYGSNNNGDPIIIIKTETTTSGRSNKKGRYCRPFSMNKFF